MRHSQFLVAGLLALTTLSFTACSSSDDDVEKPIIEQPSHVADAARYKVTTFGSVWKSIELSEGGRYFIVKNASILGTKDDEILSGSYEKKGDSYVLNGFGELAITPINKSSYSLQLTNKGKVSKLTAEKVGVLPSDKNTDYLCRTWKFSQLHLTVSYDGKQVYDGTATTTSFNDVKNGLKAAIDASEYKDKLKLAKERLDDFKDFDILQTVTFTHAGSYYVTNSRSNEDVMNYWQWTNANELVIAVSEKEDGFTDKEQLPLKFEKGKLLITDSDSDGHEVVTLTVTLLPVNGQ